MHFEANSQGASLVVSGKFRRVTTEHRNSLGEHQTK